MNREDIIREAEEAGISIGAFSGRYQRQLERFAARAAEWGAKQEREACAKYLDDCNEWDMAEVIRKRGEVKP